MNKRKQKLRKRRRMKKLSIIFNDTFFVVCAAMTLVGSIGMAYGVYLYLVGFHNMDLAYNMALMSNDVNNILNQTFVDYRDLSDRYAIGKSASYSDFYVVSSNSMPKAMYFVVSCSILFSCGIAGMIGCYNQARR